MKRKQNSPGNVPSAGMPTASLASALGLQDQSLRKRYNQTGSFWGVQPIKLPNGKLRWPNDSVERLVAPSKHIEGGLQ